MNPLAFVLAGLFCGFIDSCLGMGFGVTSTTILVTFGVEPAIASASVHTAEAVIDIVSAAAHYNLGNVNFKISRHILFPGIIASVLGAIFVSNLSLKVAKPLVQVGLLVMGLFILYRYLLDYKPTRKIGKYKAMILGFIAAFVDVAVGGGWGPLGTSTLILSGEEPKKAVGTIEFTEPIISLVAVLTFGLTVHFKKFMWAMVIPMIIGGFILTPIASAITSKMPRRLLGILIGLWLIILNVYGLMK